MDSPLPKDKLRQKRAAVRIGRPPRELAGEIDDRILDTARRVFLERGLEGASIEEIARLAHSAKRSIYGRFPTKEALFAAVARRNSARVMARFGSDAIRGATIEERLASVGANILEHLLAGDAIDFMRLSIIESRRFPDLVNAGRTIRERTVQAVMGELKEAAHSDELGIFPALAPEHLPTTTQFFLELVVRPLLFRALLEDDIERLQAEIKPHVARSVAFFLAGCRHSLLE